MKTIRLYWEFFKSTLLLNVGFSFAIAIVVFPAFFFVFPLTLMTFGPAISLFYKEISRKNEYFFYYNQGISKMGLIAAVFGGSFLIAMVLLLIFPHVESFGN